MATRQRNLSIGDTWKPNFRLLRFPQFRSHLAHYSSTLGHSMLSLLQRFLNSKVTWHTTVLHWDTEWCPYYRGSSIQRSLGTLQFYTGTQNGVLITEVPQFRGHFIQYSTEYCPCYRDFLSLRVCNTRFPMYC